LAPGTGPGGPLGNLGQHQLLLFNRGQRLLHDLGRGLPEAALARPAEVVRRLEQAEQRGGLLLQRGLVVEIVARQVGKAELVFGGEFPGQLQLDGLAQGLGGAHQLGRGGLLELQQDVGGLDLHPLAAVQLNLRRGLGLGHHAAGLEFSGFFKQCKHGRDCPMRP
jgi:hypothetical protein